MLAARRSFASMPSPARISLGLAVFVCLALAIALLWSRGGAGPTVEMTVVNDKYSVDADGQKFEAVLHGPRRGGVEIRVFEFEQLPSLPRDAGIDSVHIIDRDTGRTLLQDDFSGDLSAWSSSENIVVDAGLAQLGTSPDTQGFLVIDGELWTDYIVEVRGRNLQHLRVSVRRQADGAAVAYDVRPLRHLEQTLTVVGAAGRPAPREPGDDATSYTGPDVESPLLQTARLMAYTLVSPLPSALGVAIALAGAAITIALVPVSLARLRLPSRANEWRHASSTLLAAGIAVAMAVTTATLHWRYLDGIPHIPDAVAYLFQGDILASGRVAASAPVPPRSFEFFYPAMMWAEGDRWASVFPFGHSLALVPGVWLGAPWLVPALVAAGNVMLVFVLARRWHGMLAGLLACLLYATSPFALMNAADFMAHNTAAFYLLASITLTFAQWPRAPLAAGAGGVTFGLLFNTRPLTAVALLPAFALALALMLRAAPDRRAEMRRIGGFAAGGLAMFVAYLLYNFGTTGDPLTSGYAASGQDVLGFRGQHSFAAGLAYAHMLLAVYAVVLNGWPAWVGLSLLAAPFALGTRDIRDWLLLLAIVSVAAAYTLFPGTALAYGPRFWFETVPLAMILTARGALLLGERIGWVADRISSYFGIEERRQWTGTLVVSVVVLALAAWGTRAWLFSDSERWRSDGTPANARALREFNGVNAGLVDILSDQRFQNALVITEPCTSWQCFGTVFWMNSPNLDGRIVVTRRVDEEFRELLEAYPDRRVFLADYGASVVYPYGARKPSPNEPLFIDMNAAPLASEVLATLP